MKVVLVHGHCRYDGKRYEKDDQLDVTEHFYNCHITRFNKVAAKKAPEKKVITNDEPAEKKSEKKKTSPPASSKGKASGKGSKK